MHKTWKVNRIAGGGGGGRSFICILIQVNFKEYVNKQKKRKINTIYKKKSTKKLHDSTHEELYHIKL